MLINLIKTSTNFVGKDGKGVNFYTGSMQLQDLYDKYIVPVYRVNSDISDINSGYQRNVKKNRVNAIDDRIYTKKMDQLQDPFVDNINLNMRKNDTEKHVRPLVKGKDKYGDFLNLNTMRIISVNFLLLMARQDFKAE